MADPLTHSHDTAEIVPSEDLVLEAIAKELLAHAEFGRTDGANRGGAYEAAKAVWAVALAALTPPETAEAVPVADELQRIITDTESKNAADLEDMANVGHAIMSALKRLGRSYSNSPEEVLFDLENELFDAKREMDAVIAAMDRTGIPRERDDVWFGLCRRIEMLAAERGDAVKALETAREALKPFSDYADPLRTAYPDDMPMTKGSSIAARQVTAGDFRRARAAYHAAARSASSQGGDKEADFAAIGRSFMTSFDVVAKSEGPYSGYSPAEDPAELVLDLFNDLEEMRQKLADAVKALETAREDLAHSEMLRKAAVSACERLRMAASPEGPIWGRWFKYDEAPAGSYSCLCKKGDGAMSIAWMPAQGRPRLSDTFIMPFDLPARSASSQGGE